MCVAKHPSVPGQDHVILEHTHHGLHLACHYGMPATHTHGIAPAYRRRTPETDPLYQVLAEHMETFIERTRSSDRQLPDHVEEELRAYLECGILAHGFLRVRCEDCAGAAMGAEPAV